MTTIKAVPYQYHFLLTKTTLNPPHQCFIHKLQINAPAVVVFFFPKSVKCSTVILQVSPLSAHNVPHNAPCINLPHFMHECKPARGVAFIPCPAASTLELSVGESSHRPPAPQTGGRRERTVRRQRRGGRRLRVPMRLPRRASSDGAPRPYVPCPVASTRKSAIP